MFDVIFQLQTDFYRLRLKNYSGNAGDSFMHRHNDLRFTTLDNDNDNFADENCSPDRGGGGWWFDDCSACHLNGINFGQHIKVVTFQGIYWSEFVKSDSSLKSVTMSIRPSNAQD